jgi:hypothetical protein
MKCDLKEQNIEIKNLLHNRKKSFVFQFWEMEATAIFQQTVQIEQHILDTNARKQLY